MKLRGPRVGAADRCPANGGRDVPRAAGHRRCVSGIPSATARVACAWSAPRAFRWSRRGGRPRCVSPRTQTGMAHMTELLEDVFGADRHLARVCSFASGVAGVLNASQGSIAAVGRSMAALRRIQGKSGIRSLDRLLRDGGRGSRNSSFPWSGTSSVRRPTSSLRSIERMSTLTTTPRSTPNAWRFSDSFARGWVTDTAAGSAANESSHRARESDGPRRRMAGERHVRCRAIDGFSDACRVLPTVVCGDVGSQNPHGWGGGLWHDLAPRRRRGRLASEGAGNESQDDRSGRARRGARRCGVGLREREAERCIDGRRRRRERWCRRRRWWPGC